MTIHQLRQAKRIIHQHYGLNRPVTTDEVIAERDNLARKKGNFDYLDQRLYSSLVTGEHPIYI